MPERRSCAADGQQLHVSALSGVNLAVTQRARQGGSATIKCKYPAEENSVKKFCRENENSQCANLISSYMANYTIRGRLSLTDNKEQQEFTVTISTLTQDDAGTYQCAMTRINSNSSVCLTESVYAADNQLHYSSIVCQRDSVTVSTDGDVLPDVTTTGSLACDYSCINSTTYPPTAKKTVSSAAEMPGEP
uniref:Immunoglobulin V-set domain-containing protein n=1 Tax=Mola mola TaxID=94237 RepID=A0A3Q3XBQ2_MOLML